MKVVKQSNLINKNVLDQFQKRIAIIDDRVEGNHYE
jgi:hypothetical protein